MERAKHIHKKECTFILKNKIIFAILTTLIFIYRIFNNSIVNHDIEESERDKIDEQLVFINCTDIQRPKTGELLLRNGVWHYLVDNLTTTYFLGTYFDDRPPGRRNYIRAYPISTIPIGKCITDILKYD